MKRPSSIDDLPAYLDSFLPPEAKGRAYVSVGYVAVTFTISDGLFLSIMARKYARDFILAACATGLPIKGAQVVIVQPDGKPGLSVTLGANLAAMRGRDTWTNPSAGPTVFINWIKDVCRVAGCRQGPDGAHLGGPWAN